MTITDPDQVSATPIYTITVTSSGVASVNGEEITGPGDPAEARVAALAEVRIKAALHGRPVRVIAKDADGSAWPLIVAVDGSVTTLDHPHPTAPPTPPVTASTPPTPPPPAAAAGHPAPRMAPPPAPQPPPPTPASRPIVPRTGPEADAARRRLRAMSPAWASPLPPAYTPLWDQVTAREKAGDLAGAIITADEVERALTQQYGPLHPYTVNVMTVRATFTLHASRRADIAPWAETTDLLIQTARRRQEAKAEPETETADMIHDAHAAWRRLAADDPEYAREIADQLMDVLIDDEKRSNEVIRWIESGEFA